MITMGGIHPPAAIISNISVNYKHTHTIWRTKFKLKYLAIQPEQKKATTESSVGENINFTLVTFNN